MQNHRVVLSVGDLELKPRGLVEFRIRRTDEEGSTTYRRRPGAVVGHLQIGKRGITWYPGHSKGKTVCKLTWEKLTERAEAR